MGAKGWLGPGTMALTSPWCRQTTAITPGPTVPSKNGTPWVRRMAALPQLQPVPTWHAPAQGAGSAPACQQGGSGRVRAGGQIGENLRPAASYICSCKWKELDSPWASSLISLTSSPSAARAARRRSASSRVEAQTQCNGSATSGLRAANTCTSVTSCFCDLTHCR